MVQVSFTVGARAQPERVPTREREGNLTSPRSEWGSPTRSAAHVAAAGRTTHGTTTLVGAHSTAGLNQFGQ